MLNPVSLVTLYYNLKMQWARFKIQLKPRRQWLVLDIGSGDGPSASADVLCDRYIGDDTERTAPLKLDRPFVLGDIENLPFVDGAFDFVYCKHVLEHTRHPDRAVQELQRIARAGYVEVPSEYTEKAARSTPSHLWYVRQEDGALVFYPKKAGVLEPFLNDIFERELVFKDPIYMAFYWARFYDLFNIGVLWEKDIPYRIAERRAGEEADFEKGQESASTDEQIRRLREALVQIKSFGKRASPFARLKKSLKGLARRYYAAGKSFDFLKIVACPFCKKAVALEAPLQRLTCSACGKWFPWVEGVPCLIREAAKDVQAPGSRVPKATVP